MCIYNKLESATGQEVRLAACLHRQAGYVQGTLNPRLKAVCNVDSGLQTVSLSNYYERCSVAQAGHAQGNPKLMGRTNGASFSLTPLI